MKTIERPYYLNKIIRKSGNGMIKLLPESDDVENRFYCLISFMNT